MLLLYYFIYICFVTFIRKNRLPKSRANIIVFLYIYWLICGSIFLHFHVLHSGEIIQHRHPYPFGKKDSGHHNENEILTFSSDYIIELLVSPFIPDFTPKFRDWFLVWKFLQDTAINTLSILLTAMRGPPPSNLSLQ